MLNMQPAVAGLSVMDFNLCMCSFCFAFCVYPILFVYLFFSLSEVLINKDVYLFEEITLTFMDQSTPIFFA